MHLIRTLTITALLCTAAFAQNEDAPASIDNSPDISLNTPNTLSPEEKAQGWRLLFDGTKLIGMRGVQRSDPISSGWKIKDGELNLPKEIRQMDRVTGGDLMTSEQYFDFEFRFEWKTAASSESGVRYLVAEQIGRSPEGLEYQIIDDIHNSRGLKGGPIVRSGSLEGVLPPGANGKLRNADPLQGIREAWNEGRIVVQGTKVQHWMNGEMVLEFELGNELRKTAAAARARIGMTWGSKRLTRIAILDQGTEVAYRNLKIRVLNPAAAATPTPKTAVPTAVPAIPAIPATPRPPTPPVAPLNPYLLPKTPPK